MPPLPLQRGRQRERVLLQPLLLRPRGPGHVPVARLRHGGVRVELRHAGGPRRLPGHGGLAAIRESTVFSHMLVYGSCCVRRLDLYYIYSTTTMFL